ncbi:MAG TPA: type II CAAX endopeptidase family protein [Actinomycetota bacterium]|nr:type II CAAX endopeptidase family protein [Actinomycetota bacterium]
MLIVALMVAGAVAVVVGWWLVRSGVASVWVAMGVASGAVGVAALATGRVEVSPEMGWMAGAAAGLASGVLLYAATVAFVLVVRRLPVFDRHVAEIYDQRKGLPLFTALVVAAGVTAPGEELFWRGLFQGRLEESFGPGLAALLTWAGYVGANAASASLPILAGAMVSGAVWGALAAWTGGVLASAICHGVWTGLMLAFPPGGPSRREERPDRSRA